MTSGHSPSAQAGLDVRDLATAISRTLRIGIVTDDPIYEWQSRCANELAAVDGVEIVRWFLGRRRKARSARRGPRADASVPASLVRLSPDGIDVNAGGARLDSRRSTEPIDILVNLTQVKLDPSVVAETVWSFAYGTEETPDAWRAALVDYVERRRGSRVALIQEPGARLLRAGWLQTVSWWRGELLDHLLADPGIWPALAARELVQNIGPVGSPSRPRRRAASRIPGPVLVGGAIGRRMVGIASSVLRQPDWNIGILDAPIGDLLSHDPASPVTWLPARPGHYSADPFGIERDGCLHIFFEDYDQRLGIGTIQHVSVDADGEVSAPEAILASDVHMSYPFLVESAGSTFLLPETSAARELVLYEATDFPRSWRPVATLLSGIPIVDATVVRHEDRWWMFATRTDAGDNDNLFLWYSSDLAGPWAAHPGSPVKTDVRSSRPAGTPFVLNGTLYRPAQDSSRIYGGRVSINRIDVLTTRVFIEEPAATISPITGSGYEDGLHTISSVGTRTLIDGNAMRPIPAAMRRSIGRGFRRLIGATNPTSGSPK